MRALRPAAKPGLFPAALLFLTLSPAALAQVPPAPGTGPRVHPAPPGLRQGFDVAAATVQVLDVPDATPANGDVAVEVVLGGSSATLQLAPYDVRAAGFRLYEQGAQGLRLLPTPASATWRGTVAGDPSSAVAATLVDGAMTAYVRLGSGALWVVQPVREVDPAAGPSLHIVFRSQDSLVLPFTCGVQGQVPAAANVGGEDVNYVCQVGIEADFPYYQANGSSTTNTQNDITGIVNAMDLIYRTDVQIVFSVTQIIVNTSTDPYTSSSAGTLLGQFANYWNAVRGNVTRDVAHLFTGRPMGQTSNGAIGIAYLGVVCNLGSAYSVSQSRFTSNFAYRVAVTAHEIGHNFGAGHCDAAPPCNIMCSGVGGCANNPSTFSQGERNQINAYRQTVGCLSPQQTTPQITAVSPSSIGNFYPAAITLTGTGFTGTTQVQFGSTTVTTGIQVVSDTQLRVTPPHALPFGFLLVRTTNASGTSNAWPLAVGPTFPCQIRVPNFVVGGNSLTWEMGGYNDDPAYLVVSLLNTTTPFQGYPLLDNLSTLWFGQLDTRGFASFTIAVPPMVLNGFRVYSQLLDVNPANFTLRSASSVSGTVVYF